ncbi:MAG: septum formation initiator family protein [Caldisericaceae bacterium]
MKKNVVLIFVVLVLFLCYGAVYLSTVRLQRQLDAINKQLDSLSFEQEALREQLFYYSSPERINEIATKKLGMIAPKNFYIVDLEHGK